MQAKTDAAAAETASLLENFGMELAAGGLLVMLTRLPSTWLAADAVAALLEAGALRDWGRLVALYPGW
jgi:hypothetical protein